MSNGVSVSCELDSAVSVISGLERSFYPHLLPTSHLSLHAYNYQLPLYLIKQVRTPHFQHRFHYTNSSESIEIMEKLNAILQKYVAQGSDTEGKLLGAAFVLTNSQGTTHIHLTIENQNKTHNRVQRYSTLAQQAVSALKRTLGNSTSNPSPGSHLSPSSSPRHVSCSSSSKKPLGSTKTFEILFQS